MLVLDLVEMFAKIRSASGIVGNFLHKSEYSEQSTVSERIHFLTGSAVLGNAVK